MEFLINLTIKSTLILLLSGSTLWLLKNTSATLRHWVISLTMIGLLGLPVLLGLLPAITVTIPYLPVREAPTTIITNNIKEAPKEIIKLDKEKTHFEMPSLPIEKGEGYQVDVFESTDNQYLEPVYEPVERSQFSTISMTHLLSLIWLLGVLFFVGKILIGRYLIYEITIKSEAFYLSEPLQDYVTKFTQKQVLLLESKAIKTPMTWGGIKPVILLPKGANLWPESELRTVLIHELNHVKRNDYCLHLLGLFATCLYWYNPLVWLMKKQQLLEREKACDEAVLNMGIPQQNYAQQLIDIARGLSGKSPMLKEHALPMAKISQTKARVLAILKFDHQKFRFSKWKQWNWGLFYACLFPVLAAFSPVGKVIQAQFDLPKLDNIDRFLTIDKSDDIVIPKTILTGSTNENTGYSEATNIDYLETLNRTTELEILEKKDKLLAIKRASEEIELPQRPQKTGLFGKWKAGKSEFTIWTYGEFKIIPTPPYIEVIDTSGIVFIEEYIPGLFRDKINQLTIGKASVDGRMGEGYKGKLSTLIPKGTPIKIWSDNTNYEQWMATKGKELPMYLLKKQKEKAIKEVTADNSEWWKRIKGSKKWLNNFFVPDEKIAKQVKIEDGRLVLDLEKIPYKRLDLPQGNLAKRKMGRATLPENGNGNTIGNLSTNPKGIKYVTVLKGDKTPALAKDFNFHLAENDFNGVKFSLQLYNLEDGEIGYAITKQPIPITLKDAEKGWIKMDLSAYNIVTSGDVLVVLTNNGFSGTKRQKKLYFSLAENHQDYQPLLVENWKTKIWEKAFVMYLGMQQTSDKIGVGQRMEEKGYLIKWKVGKSVFKVWTYGEYKIIPTAPYFEVIDPDGIVFIEEYISGLLGGGTNQLTIAKAPFAGRMRVYNWKKSIFDSPLIEKGTPIKIWGRTLSRNSYNQWMKTKGYQVAQHIKNRKQDYSVQVDAKESWNGIEQGRRQIDFDFFPEDQVLAKKERQRRLKAFQVANIPYKKIGYTAQTGVAKIMGNTTLPRNDIGHMIMSGNPKGAQYMTVLEGGDAPALIKEFNVHLSVNDFENLEFELQLYNVVDGEVKYAITKNPIPIKIGIGNGWVRRDLSDYGIVTKGDVLVVLENKDFSGRIGRKKLYFSLTENYIDYQWLFENYEKSTKRILEGDFVMYLGVEQATSISSNFTANSLNNNSIDLTADKIIETAINRLSSNYIQKPYNATLFYRYGSSPNHSDSLMYQSEAVLKYYDSKGYQKGGWRNAAASRYAKLEQGRITKGEQKEELKLEELGRIFNLWSHEPIVTNDKPLSKKSFHAYDYKLLSIKEFMGKAVYEISFVCTKLKNRFAGLPSLKYMKGKVYINQEDYAILRYEQENLMDYEYSGQPEKKRGHLKERKIIKSTSVEIFSKNAAGYYLDYAKKIDKVENQHTNLDGKKDILKGTFSETYQYLNVRTENVEPLKENLFNISNEITYNPDFWKQFKLTLNK